MDEQKTSPIESEDWEFKKKIRFDDGEEVTVSISYEEEEDEVTMSVSYIACTPPCAIKIISGVEHLVNELSKKAKELKYG